MQLKNKLQKREIERGEEKEGRELSCNMRMVLRKREWGDLSETVTPDQGGEAGIPGWPKYMQLSDVTENRDWQTNVKS